MGENFVFKCDKCQIIKVGPEEEVRKAAESHKRYTKHEVSVVQS